MNERPPSTTITVLVAEDEPHMRRILTRNLEQRGYEVTSTATAAEALDGCLASRPDVLVLDINLPDATGWDVLRGLRNSAQSRPAVVLLSAMPPLPVRLAEFGPICFLEKPFAIDTLLRAVERAVHAGVAHAV